MAIRVRVAARGTNRSRAYTSGGLPDETMAQHEFCHPLDRSTVRTNKQSAENTDQNIKPSTTISPTLSCAWLLGDSSAHQRDSESDSFLSCDELNKTEAFVRYCGIPISLKQDVNNTWVLKIVEPILKGFYGITSISTRFTQKQ